MDLPEIVEPLLPDNLNSLHDHEEEIHTKLVLEINANPKLKDQFEIFQESLDLIYDFIKLYKNKTEDEQIVQYLGIRLFNSIVTAIKLLLSGYYQVSFTIQRDILETGFLLDYFLIDNTEIQNWKKCTKKERFKKFSPFKIRDELDKRDGFESKQRGQIYSNLCEYAAHPTYSGFRLVQSKGLGKTGPFMDEKFLNAVIEELALRVPFFTIIFLQHFNDLPEEFLKAKIEYLLKIRTWAKKYLNLDLSHIKLDDLKEQADRLIATNKFSDFIVS